MRIFFNNLESFTIVIICCFYFYTTKNIHPWIILIWRLKVIVNKSWKECLARQVYLLECSDMVEIFPSDGDVLTIFTCEGWGLSGPANLSLSSHPPVTSVAITVSVQTAVQPAVHIGGEDTRFSSSETVSQSCDLWQPVTISSKLRKSRCHLDKHTSTGFILDWNHHP